MSKHKIKISSELAKMQHHRVSMDGFVNDVNSDDENTKIHHNKASKSVTHKYNKSFDVRIHINDGICFICLCMFMLY